MIEQGLVEYVQAGLAAQTPPLNVPVGSFGQLSKDALEASTPKAWTYKTIHSDLQYVLSGQKGGWTDWTVQIDCHGFTPADATLLARGISRVLDGGFTGKFADPDQTQVFNIYSQGPSVDGFNPASRTYVRSLEYVVSYNQIL